MALRTEEEDRRTVCSLPHTITSVEESISTEKPHKPERVWRWPGLCGPDSEADPRSYSTTKKYTILLIVATAGAISPIASTIYVLSYPNLKMKQ
ncbi:hypothetical protein DFQ29_001260 [Apophysomyces sp. BC1021]|nr:hypothetical protein DFQ29_001260 [Apophysomyces sp. BC1021]